MFPSANSYQCAECIPCCAPFTFAPFPFTCEHPGPLFPFANECICLPFCVFIPVDGAGIEPTSNLLIRQGLTTSEIPSMVRHPESTWQTRLSGFRQFAPSLPRTARTRTCPCAGGTGFEPAGLSHPLVFKTSALSHSANHPHENIHITISASE